MTTPDYNKILHEILDIKDGLQVLTHSVERMERDLRSEMALKHQAIDFSVEKTANRLSLVEKILFGAVSFILLAVLGALITRVIV